MPENRPRADNRPPTDREIERLAHDALRHAAHLFPATLEDVARVEAGLAADPEPIPTRLATADWLFNRPRGLATGKHPASTPPSANLSVAARDGGEITPAVRAAMSEDRDRAEAAVRGEPMLPGGPSFGGVEFATPSRFREIAEFAEAVAAEHQATGRIDPLAIVQRKGFTHSFGRYDAGFDGLLEHRSGLFHVYCNLDRVEAAGSDRARFTVAHELAHYFIDEHRRELEQGRSLPLSVCEFESKHPIEREADHFAANLLMPTAKFRKQARGTKPGFKSVLSLKAAFGTSITSTACRYAELGIAPVVVIKWGRAGVTWKFMSDEARSAGLGAVVGSTAALPEGSATAEALAGRSTPPEGFFRTGSTAAMWFPRVGHGGWRNAILVEEAMSLGRFGVLTLLYPESGWSSPAA